MKGEVFVSGGRVAGAPPGAPCVLRIEDGFVADFVGAAPPGAHTIDASGRFLSPMLVDAHVHLAFAAHKLGPGPGQEREPGPEAERPLRELCRRLLSSGVAGALDLGMPERLLGALAALDGLHFSARSSGPLLTAPGGYPTQSWGRDGYGRALSSSAEAREAVAQLADAGARAVKLSLDRRFPVLAPEVAKAAAQAGQARGLRVFAHALDAQAVRAALEAGADVLAHVPTGPLPGELVREAGARGLRVLSTLHAFGGGETLLRNLSALRAAGCSVVYGTDLGNEGTAPGICAAELELLARAGLPPAEIALAATARAADLLGLPALGRIAVGSPAHLLALDCDPFLDAAALARPVFAVVAGEVRRPAAGAAG